MLMKELASTDTNSYLVDVMIGDCPTELWIVIMMRDKNNSFITNILLKIAVFTFAPQNTYYGQKEYHAQS